MIFNPDLTPPSHSLTLPGGLITATPEMFLPLTALLLLLSLLSPPGLSSPARVIRQRLPKFKNFPIVGLKSPEPAELEDHRRDARETEQLEDQFVEEAVFLTPEDREQRALEDVGLETLFEDDGLKTEEAESYKRIERDGGHGHHHAGSHRGGRHHEPAQVEVEYEADDYESYDYNDYNDYVEPTPVSRQQPRRGKQTGATGVALGVLSNPPSQEGNYNFNFSNDDGSSRQEVGAPDAIRGSYSFITPEGEEVSVQYHADETGFHATGSHVPQAPPMPAHVQRLLDHLAKVNGLKRL